MRCYYCNNRYTKRNNNHKYCSSDCSQKHRLQESNAKDSWRKEKNCIICEIIFTPKSANNVYCSPECSKKTTDADFLLKNRDKLDFLQGKQISYLRLRITIFDRDGFCCCYCGRSPQIHKTVLHIDHKIAKKNGGTDEISNLITACSECNLGKGDYLLKLWNEKNSK